MMLCAAPVPWAWGNGEGWQQAALMTKLAERLASRPTSSLANALIGDRDLIGWAYMSEGWALSGPDATTWRRGVDRISESPRRVEVRILTAADRAGYRYMVLQHRGKHPEVCIDRNDHEVKRNDELGLSGTIADAVAALAAALPVGEVG
jgi:hypothetical protein